MSIRFKKYHYKDGWENSFKAIKITHANLTELVAYICRNGGAATGHLGDTSSSNPARIRIKQRNYGPNWGKRDWRVARVGDYIVRHDFPEGGHGREIGAVEFERVKRNFFETTAELG